MNSRYLVGLCLAAVLAMLALGVAPAMGVSKFLLNGEVITTEMNFEGESTTNDILFEDTKSTIATDILCSKYEDYSGFWPFRLLLEWLMLNREALVLPGVPGVPGTLADCEDMAKNCSSVTVAVNNLPLEDGEVQLSGTTYFMLTLNVAGKEPSFTIVCESLLGKVEDTCKGEFGAILTNVTGGVDAEWSETNETINPPLTCSVGGAKTGLIVGVSLLKSSSGTLTVSE